MAKAADFLSGDKVYNDTFAGLVPAIVIGPLPVSTEQAMFRTSRGEYLRVKYTATRGAYKKGETDIVSANRLVKREWVYVRGGQYRIMEGRRRRR